MYSQDEADREYEFNSRYDYVQEAYGATAVDSALEMTDYERSFQEREEAFNWLIEQGGLVEMSTVSEDFYDATFYQLERDGKIKRVVPEGCSRMCWAIDDQCPAAAIPIAVLQPPIEPDEYDIPF